MLRTCTWLMAALALLAAAPAAAGDWAIQKLVYEDDPDPIAGTLHQTVGEIDIDDAGRVTLVSYVFDGSSTVIKIFRVTGGTLAIDVAEDDVAPGTGGALFLDVNRSRIAAPGVLAHLGLYLDGLDVRWGAFLRSGGSYDALALPGDAVPGGGTISKVEYIHAANPAAEVAFGAEIDTGGGIVGAQLVGDAGGLREILREGDAAPGAVGGTFTGVQTWWTTGLADDGSAVFYAEVSGGSADDGIFHATPLGAVSPLLLEGDSVTTPGGGTFTGFGPFVGANPGGDAIFAASVLRPPETIFSYEGIFAMENGSQREIVYRGDEIPGTSPARYFLGLAGTTPPELNAKGDAAFAASVEDQSGVVLERAVLVERSGVLQIVAREGDPVPGVPGALFSDFPEVRIDAAGRIAFYAFTSDGSGFFLATPVVPVPAVPPLGLALGALALLACGLAMRGRSAI